MLETDAARYARGHMPRPSSRYDRLRDDDWVPIVGEVVCAHPDLKDATYAYLARIIDFISNMDEGYARYRLRPLCAPRTSDRELHRLYLERTLLTFQGYVCVSCKKGNIR